MTQQNQSGSLNLSNAERQIFLVRVPEDIAELWEKSQDDVEVAKLCLTRSGENCKMSLVMADSILQKEETIPTYDLEIQDISQQESIIFSKSISDDPRDDGGSRKEILAIEGKVGQKLDCTTDINTYIKHKGAAMKKAFSPVFEMNYFDNTTEKIANDTVRQHPKVEYQPLTKSKNKCFRKDKEVVQQMLFKAFERHQYYHMKDLLRITQQPRAYLIQIMKEYCIFHAAQPHRHLWELKPEYRHYKNKK